MQEHVHTTLGGPGLVSLRRVTLVHQVPLVGVLRLPSAWNRTALRLYGPAWQIVYDQPRFTLRQADHVHPSIRILHRARVCNVQVYTIQFIQYSLDYIVVSVLFRMYIPAVRPPMLTQYVLCRLHNTLLRSACTKEWTTLIAGGCVDLTVFSNLILWSKWYFSLYIKRW